jgi:hypothetical protein
MKTFLQIVIVPNLRAVVAYLRSRDANDAGIDDEAAAAIELAITRLELWLNQ